MRLRNLLNELKWRHDDLDSVQIVVRHRGAPDDELRIDGMDILEVGNKGLFVAADDARASWEAELVDNEERRKFLPWHRILAVNGRDGVLWIRRSEGGDHADD